MTVLRNFIDFRKIRSSVARVTFSSRSFIRASRVFFSIIILCIVVVDSDENNDSMFYMDSGFVPLFV